MILTERQKKIIEIVKKLGPITGEEIANQLKLTKSALRTDFSILRKLSILNSKQKIGYTFNKDIKEFNEKNLVKDIMSYPITVDESYSVHKTILLMFEKDVGTIFITKNDNLSGIVSRKDLLRIAIGKTDIENIPINLIMTRTPNIIYSTEDEKIEECVKKIITHEIDSVPVIRVEEKDEKKINKVVGRLTKTNIAKLLLNILENKN